jgi:hypothetical protein
MTIRPLLLLVAICFSTTAFPQSAPLKVGNKPPVRVKPKEPTAVKLVGTVPRHKAMGRCVEEADTFHVIQQSPTQKIQ